MGFDDDAYSVEAYDKIITEGAMITESFRGGAISSSYSRIKFIALFRYLTLYHVSNSES